MALDFQVVPIAFTKGQDTRTQKKLVLPGKWQTLINYSLSADNTPRRRDGSQQLAGSFQGNGLALHGSELLALNGPNASTYSAAKTAMEMRSGETGFVNLSKSEVQRENSMQDSPDCASGLGGTGGQYTCYVWRELSPLPAVTGVNCTLIDELTGAKLIDNLQLRTSTGIICVRVVYSKGAFFVFYIDGTGLFCRVIDPSSSLTPGMEVALVTSANLTHTPIDACNFGSNASSSVMVVFGWSDGVTSVRTIHVVRAGTVPSLSGAALNLVANATIASANLFGLSCESFDAALTNFAGAFILHSGGVSGVVINATFVVTTAVALLDAFAPTGVSHICCCATAIGSSCMQVFSDNFASYGTAAISPIRTGAWNTTLVPVLAAATLINSSSFGTGAAPASRGPQGPWISGKPFAGPPTTAAGGNPVVFLPVCMLENSAFSTAAPNNNTQCTWLLLDCTTTGFTGTLLGTAVAKALYGSYGLAAAGTSAPGVFAPCSSPAVANSIFATLVSERTLLEISNGLNVSPTGLARLTMTPNVFGTPPSRAELGPLTYFSGGQLTTYDGSRVVEHGFPLFPEGVGAVIAAGAGMDDGVHQIVAVYEWFDARGGRHQSSPSLPVSVTANSGASNNQATVNVPTLLLSQKPGIEIVLYMTQADALTFRRLTLRSAAGGHPVANNTAAAFVSVTVTESDAQIAGNEVLYTQPTQAGTTLPSDAPPPCKALTVSQNRLWLLSQDNNLEYRYSQELLTGFGLQFSGLFGDTTLGGLVPAESGGTVAISSLDEKTILLCNRKLYVVYGGAPDPSGLNNTLTEPQEIPSPVGCSDANSVLQMPMGLIFKAQSGWHILGRDLSVTYIGAGVSSYDNSTVSSAVLMRDRQECRFETQTFIGGNGTCLVFSYLLGEWSVFRRLDLNGDGGFIPAADALWYPNSAAYVFINGQNNGALFGIFQDVPLFLPGGAPSNLNPDDFVGSGSDTTVTTSATTAWLKISALEGFQRVRRLYLTGTPLNGNGVNTTFTINVGFDDHASIPPGYQDAINPLSVVDNTIDLRHKLRIQKCKSVQFTFIDVPIGLDGTPFGGIQALALEIGVKKGLNKLPAGQTV